MEGDFQEIGWLDGFQVFVQYAKEGPDMEEAYALYQEAKNSVLFQSLAAAENDEKSKDIREQTETIEEIKKANMGDRTDGGGI